MRVRIIILFFLILTALPLTTARVVRLAPLPKLTYDGVRYEPVDMRAGILQAFDAKTGELLWEKRLYDHFKKPLLEPDAVWEYVEGIFLDKENGRLMIVNTNDTLIALDLKSRESYVIERTRGITMKIANAEEGSTAGDELLILDEGEVLFKFPSATGEG